MNSSENPTPVLTEKLLPPIEYKAVSWYLTTITVTRCNVAKIPTSYNLYLDGQLVKTGVTSVSHTFEGLNDLGFHCCGCSAITFSVRGLMA